MRARSTAVVLAVVGALALGLPALVAPAAAASPCDPPVRLVACENTQPGSSRNEWDISASGDPTIQGFATDMSVDKGSTVGFKVKTDAPAFRADIYRVGYYGGTGARKVATVPPGAVVRHTQPPCIDQPATGLLDCGNWGVSATWAVPSTAVSGVYFALLTRTDTGGRSHIVFVVRDDARSADILFQTSDTTWQAYNDWGDTPTNGRSLYPGPNGKAVKVSYNRPFRTRGGTPAGRDFFFSHEYAMVRWLEANGYDVAYTTNIDTDRRGALLRQHEVFLSTGHDEYWSGAQRANVEAARDAGVHLAFFSGNSVYWKTRWEPSVDGSGTPYRTLVTYKETHAGAKIDPDPAWTGTWRDPRFSPPADGGRPENALMGTLYKVNSGTFAIEVPAAEGKLRLWRNTSVANLAAGQTAVLAPETLGYEWDEDLDNGFRPKGLIRLSSTTKNVPEYLYDYGSTVAPGVATHHLTLYKAPSGALVFGGGTIQWSWGLDGNHDGGGGPPDVRMQQATVNLLADMGVQPVTRQPNLVAATRSTDTTAPTTAITSPAGGATLSHNADVTVTGTASDTGGRVGGVEVSVDGGATWHPAQGRESWTYTGPASRWGQTSVQARATDDSGNIGNPASVPVTVNCPCTVFPARATPGTPASADSSAIEVGMKFRTEVAGSATGVRFYKGPGNTGTHTGSIWSAEGNRLATATFTGETESGWQQVSFASPVALAPGTTYVVSYLAPNGRYGETAEGFLGVSVDSPPLHGLRSGADGGNGVFRYGGGFPSSTYRGGNYWVDVVFSTTGGDTTPPTITARAPAPNSTGAPTSTPVTATFDEPVQPATITFTLTSGASTPVAATVAYDGPSRTATLTPAAPLAATTAHTATVSGIRDVAGNAMAAPSSWTFTTGSGTGTGCPCTIWSPTAVPGTAASPDTARVELGVKFRATRAGFVDGIRFYKGPGNTGTHTGTLWSAGGQSLATVTFGAETSGGWQQALFATPVPVTAGATYVASYLAPAGRYSYDAGFFTSSGVTNGPLRALAAGEDGPNGVYLYGGGFPTASHASANYWVDVVFSDSGGGGSGPRVTSTEPTAGATGVPTTTAVRAAFDTAIQPATLNFTLTVTGGSAVAGSVAYDAPSRTATFTPGAPLSAGLAHTADVRGATDAGGRVMTPVTWSFTTAGPASGTCCTIWSPATVPGTVSTPDPNPYELGVKFRADSAGTVTGIRFYKSPSNTGTHTGSLWSATGTLLATVEFTGEKPSGWQQANFSQPVTIAANTTYVASYRTSTGYYSSDGGYFTGKGVDNPPLRALASGVDGGNGVYAVGSGFPDRTWGNTNYWVDVVFTPGSTPPGPGPDTTPPTVTATVPADGATGVSRAATVGATFSEAVDPASVSLVLRDPAGATVPGAVTYDGPSRTARLTPAAQLAASTTFRATVSGARDAAGNTMTAVSWSFTTAASTGSGCPCSIWAGATPAVAAATDTGAVELGVKFRADVDGRILGIRFYKGPGNDGPHVVNLWSATGTKLATATSSGETASGWQEVRFATSVAVTAGTTYVASYHAKAGRYSYDSGYFANSGVATPPLRALRNGEDGGNGVYAYGPGGFPTQSFGSTNYWVDVVFQPGT